jgi:hypothetical protein
VILFGSNKSGCFVLDTVLVVDSWEDHDRDSFFHEVADQIHPTYRAVTFGPLYGARSSCSNKDLGCAPAGMSYRLYYGAAVENPVEGMFSFFPCSPASSTPSGFARPTIQMTQITNTLKMAWRGTDAGSLAELKKLWDKVRCQVERAGLCLGLRAEMPRERPQAIHHSKTKPG